MQIQPVLFLRNAVAFARIQHQLGGDAVIVQRGLTINGTRPFLMPRRLHQNAVYFPAVAAGPFSALHAFGRNRKDPAFISTATS